MGLYGVVGGALMGLITSGVLTLFDELPWPTWSIVAALSLIGFGAGAAIELRMHRQAVDRFSSD
jgi:hypothetical protein